MQRLLADAEKLTGIKYDINNLDDVFNAIHVIQGELGITGTTAKEAKETLTGSFSAMKASLEDFMGSLSLGMDIKEPLANLISTTGTFLFGNLIPMVGNILKALPEAFVTAFSEIGPIMVEQGKNLMESLGVGLSDSSVFSGFGEKMMANLGPWLDAIKSNCEMIPELLRGVGQSIMEVIEVIAGGLVRLDFSGIADLAGAILPALQAGFETFMGIVGPTISTLVDSFVNLWNSIQPVLSILADALMPIFQVVASFIGGIFKGAIISLSGAFDILSGVIQFLSPVFQTLVNVLDFISPVLNKIAEWVGVVIGVFANFGSSGNSLNNILKSAWDNIKSVIEGAITIVYGAISNGIKIFNNLGSVGQMLSGTLKSAWSAITGAISKAVGTISGYIGDIRSLFKSLSKINLFEAGSSIINSFLNGLKSAWHAVTGFIGGIASWIRDHKGPIEYDRKLLIPAGRAIMSGLNKGLVSSFADVKDSILGMAGEIYQGFDISPKPIKFESELDRYKDAFGQSVIDENISLDGYIKSRDDKLYSMLIEILAYLKYLSEKDSDVYIDSEKASSILGHKIEEIRARKDKYEKRRGGILV